MMTADIIFELLIVNTIVVLLTVAAIFVITRLGSLNKEKESLYKNESKIQDSPYFIKHAMFYEPPCVDL